MGLHVRARVCVCVCVCVLLCSTLSWISSLMVGFLLVERGTLSHFTSGLMVRP